MGVGDSAGERAGEQAGNSADEVGVSNPGADYVGDNAEAAVNGGLSATPDTKGGGEASAQPVTSDVAAPQTGAAAPQTGASVPQTTNPDVTAPQTTNPDVTAPQTDSAAGSVQEPDKIVSGIFSALRELAPGLEQRGASPASANEPWGGAERTTGLEPWGSTRSATEIGPGGSVQPAHKAAALRLPQIDCSTARIPITNAIYDLFTGVYGFEGPAPLSSKTHGAWLNLADGKADILFLVAPTEDELAYFAAKNVDIEMKVYGYDGLVFIGNVSNPVNNLTDRQIRDIYSGRIVDWMDVGGESADVIVYVRNKESGSQRLFESLVWDGYDIPDFSMLGFREDEGVNPVVTQRIAQIIIDDGMEDITRNVILNQYSIGFNIMSYIDSEFSGSALKLFSINGYMPCTENFISGKYPFLTTSYVAIRADEPADSPARRLYDWVGSSESRELIARNSTLTVAFSDSIIIKAGEGFNERAGSGAGAAAAAAGSGAAGSTAAYTTAAVKEDIIQMIPRLNGQYIRRTDLFPYDADDLAYLRNGIFALSGKIFVTEKYRVFFNNQSWYVGTEQSDDIVTARFNDYQKKNLAVILAYEKEIK